MILKNMEERTVGLSWKDKSDALLRSNELTVFMVQNRFMYTNLPAVEFWFLKVGKQP